jgi:hypothetical protein
MRKGTTTSEVVNELGLDAAEANAAVVDLAEWGLIIDSGMRRPNPDTGELEIVWFVSEAGRRGDLDKIEKLIAYQGSRQ